MCAISFAAKDAVIMKVNGTDVTRSEFEYLYNKNSQQQLSPQPLDEYVEMFKLYKMKVADAKAAGLDTTSAFLKEMEQYRDELSAPYLVDSVYMNKLVEEAYKRSKQEAQAYHIMMLKSMDSSENKILKSRLDSIRNELLKGADFSEMAKKYSQDKSAQTNGGYLGYITVNRYPYNFEKNAFELREGEISEIVESPVGYHILKGGKKRPASGRVLTAHILRMASGDISDADKAKAKALIDSIYEEVVKNPDSFENLAMSFSEDPGSAKNGGKLPWFGRGEMVSEFDSVAFALKDGEISEPFLSRFGWHIIKKYDSNDGFTLNQMKPLLLSRMSVPQDERYMMIKRHQNETLGKKHKLKVNNSSLSAIKDEISRNGIDTVFFTRFLEGKEGNMQLFAIDKEAIPVKDFAEFMKSTRQNDPVVAGELFDNLYTSYLNDRLLDAEKDWLKENVSDYSNLLKEYEEGSLLYEISVRNVWDKAAKDEEGLKNFFENHRDDYTWKNPHVKGYLVQVSNDSITRLVENRLGELDSDSIVKTIRKEFQRAVQIDKVLLEKGQNQMVDYLVFGGAEYIPKNTRFKNFFMYQPRILEAPEEVNDVRGLVTGDYQTELQRAWEDELRTKYPVEINDKVLKKVKSSVR